MSTAGPRLDPPPLWRNGSFHLLWSSTFASGFGDRLATFIALALLGFAGEQSDDSSITAGLDFFFFLPYLLWSPLAGWISDRLPRRLVLLAADELRGLIVLSALLLLPEGYTGAIPVDQHWKVYTFMGLIGLMAATFVPAKFSVVPAVVGDAMLTRANGAVVTMGIIGNLAGFFVGGSLVEKSIPAAVTVCAACYMVSGSFWAFMKLRHAGHSARGAVSLGGVFREIHGGMRYVLKHRPILVLMGVSALLWMATSVYMPALAAINKLVFEGDLNSYGVLAGGLGVGMVVGGFVLAMFNARRGSEIIMVAGLLGAAVTIALQMFVPVYGLSLALSVGTGICASLLMVPLNTLIQRITPDYLMGRVFAVKEITDEFGKLWLSLLIWKSKEWFDIESVEPHMRPVAVVLAVCFAAVAVIGFFRYVLRGPAGTKTLNLLWRAARLLTEVVHRVRVSGRHHVPHTGPVLLIANHTAGVDPVLLQTATSRIITWMMAREYMVRSMRWFWKRIKPIPVDRGARDSASVREAVKRLREGGIVGIFPEGGIVAEDRLGTLNPGVVMLARRSGATIVPAWISGTPQGYGPFVSLLVPSRSHVRFGPGFRLDDGSDRSAALARIGERLEALRPGDDRGGP